MYNTLIIKSNKLQNSTEKFLKLTSSPVIFQFRETYETVSDSIPGILTLNEFSPDCCMDTTAGSAPTTDYQYHVLFESTVYTLYAQLNERNIFCRKVPVVRIYWLKNFRLEVHLNPVDTG